MFAQLPFSHNNDKSKKKNEQQQENKPQRWYLL